MLWAALLTVYVVWGSTYLAIRVMVETMPPMLSAGARFALAGAVFLLVLRLRGGLGRVRVSRRQLAAAGLVGVLLCFGGNGLVTVAEEEVPSGLAALIIGAVPLWVVLLRLMHSERVHRGTLASGAVGFAGLAVLVLPGDRPGDAPLWGVLLIVLASLSWATGSLLEAREGARGRLRVHRLPDAAGGWRDVARRLRALYDALVEVLRGSIPAERVPHGKNWLTRVRDDKGAVCPRCGTRLRKDTVAGRTAAWCPKCQRAAVIGLARLTPNARPV